MATKLQEEVKKRRTFAIISHPDAGKTTLTEKLLLYGGAIHLAGAVKAKKNQRHTTSDWMEIEKQRGISISASVLNFEYKGSIINLLDTPGHKDFSEDTYRTLTAADAAVMLIDAAKGVEPQTRKLFEVCRMRGIPIFTFVNKMDRPARDPLDLMDELEQVLGIRSCPMTWPIGSGDRFRGVYERDTNKVYFFQSDGSANTKGKLKPLELDGPDDPRLRDQLEADQLYEQFKGELELVEVAGDAFDLEKVLSGQLSPLFFGSAMNNFGVERFLERFIELAPHPYPRKTKDGDQLVEPASDRFSGFVFKIQANMDMQHRDRVAFIRVCSGKFERGMEVKHARTGDKVKLSRPLNFFAQERILVEEAFPGDIVGLVDTTGNLRIGDTLCKGERFEYERVPSFLPEYFSGVTILDPMKRKQLKKGLDQLAEEGVVQVYRQRDMGDKDPVLAAVGVLQFEVLQSRLKDEYRVDVKLDSLPYTQARWIGDPNNKFDPSFFESRQDSRCLVDRDNHFVVLFKSEWALNWARDNHTEIEFLTTPPM